jgi:histidinol-phosphate/aromatic aminotransferase/cobyric acid decarboxylase-like protein/GTP:adenosylcobinamide-phosphate guanylyltransferase
MKEGVLMQAVILAAGMGKRLKELTKECTKCMVSVNGIPLIKRMLDQLDEFHLTSITIVVGYQAKKLVDYIENLGLQTPISFIYNKDFYKTNNIHSLYLAKEILKKEDTLLLESDLIFDHSLLDELINNPFPSLALVDKYESWMDGTVIKLNESHRIINFLSGKEMEFSDKGDYYKTVNIYKFSKEFSTTHYVPFLEAYCIALGNNEYYEQVLKVISLLEKPEIKALPITSGKWYEIDDVQDLNIAESIFANPEDKLAKFEARYGGYWRYPHLLDFCYLVNPFFPNHKLLEELKANMEQVICSYPSGLSINNLLAAKYYGVNPEQICVGNGASELIKILMECQTGKVGIIYPTFEEYSGRLSEEQIVPFFSKRPCFSYTATDLMEHYETTGIQSLVIINPDNPSGHYLSKNELVQLLDWTKEKEITFILDESFVDFSEDGISASLLSKDVLEGNPHLIVVKSISKSYGIPGLRLGIIASSNEALMQLVRKEVSIWNINSLGEYFLQIVEKYQDEYLKGLEHFKEVRNQYLQELHALKHLKVYPTQSSYVMCQVVNGRSSKKLTEILLNDHDIFIKDLSRKMGFENGEYIRLAVKDEKSNAALVAALKCILK